MSKLELILLGRFECLLPSGTRITLSMRKAEVLLAYLALAPGLRHPRERLINLLWSDRGEEQARNSLRQCLSSIRKSLGDLADLVLLVDRTTVCLQAELIDVDVHEFERLIGESDYESLATAAELYQGEFLEGISIRDPSSQEWLDSERGRFKRQFIEILTNLAETRLVTHDFGNAIRTAETLVKQDPLGESGWRLLMRAYFEKGDRAHALQAFKRCQQVLGDELDIEPESATIELREQIAAGETRPEPALAAIKPSQPASDSNGHSIAILPFDNLSGDPEQEYFSDGITDSIILHLSLFPDLSVKSRNSSFAYKQQIKSIGEISQELGVDYLVEGSIRKSGDRIRITVQLIEAASGNQVWGKRYDAEIENLFDLEEELSRSIAATVTGQIESELQRIALAKGAADQQAYDLLLSGTYHVQRFNGADTLIAIDKLNQCLAQDRDNLRAHVMLYACHSMQFLGRWTEDYRASFAKAETHIQKALELDPESGLVHAYCAECLSLKGELDEATKHIEKALAINPNDPDALAVQAFIFEDRCDFEAALEAAERAISLDPYHPWAEWEVALSQYFLGHHEAALKTATSFRTSPGFLHVIIVSALIRLGRVEQARQALQDFLQECRDTMLSMPQTLDEWYQFTRESYPFEDESCNRDFLDCLVQAGLGDQAPPKGSLDHSEDLPSILVLPFNNLSGDPEQEYFSDGISESIIVNLSSFSGLNVKSRHASFAFKQSSKSLDEIANELGIKYIVEGSIRKFGDNVRITVQLGDTHNGNQIWGKRYDSPLEDIFSLEEDLVRTIAGTVSGRIEHENRVMSLHKPAKDMRSYDYLMRGGYHLEKFNATDCDIAKQLLKKCLEIDPDNSEALTQLAIAHSIDLFENWSEDRALTLSESHHLLQKSVQLAPENAYTHAYLAEHQMFTRNFKLGLSHAEKSIELNPTLPDGYSNKAYLLAICGRIDEALENAEISLQIDPHHYYMGWNAGEVFRMAGQYQKAIDSFRKIPHPSPSVHAEIAVCLAALGQMDEARIEMRHYHQLAREQMPNYPQSEQDWRDCWHSTTPYLHQEDFEKFFNQLKQAGLYDDLA